MTDEAKNERCEVRFFGNVQGVGFRYTTQYIAQRFAVTGYVQNMPDGSVYLVAEGKPEEIDLFLAAVDQRMQGYIERTTRKRSDATGRFSRFEIRF